ncbi:hypothetical protein MT325_m519L [Paramecium bursaria chlorella virus MT325]|uniref:Uncharacterized protein m519L n=2 Tax=Paramecium bursaria Chlorella virus A1 TaxID=381899 RepID=A7IUP9_PBCVM|nr:hypothetical protein FR483_n526L [Paramecium bursaria Chlorella virus FR483]ABT14073.1 hypothetical protein MT325_m519L [Paramecium bursaria chlorella virus MT325]ABT15811.1 hypothetical protein FR483_n526L [Paramecium bursaria Chlorella virus FR483]
MILPLQTLTAARRLCALWISRSLHGQTKSVRMTGTSLAGLLKKWKKCSPRLLSKRKCLGWKIAKWLMAVSC